MQRMASPMRQDWQQKLEQHGFLFHSEGGAYWNESACYRFSAAQIDVLETAIAELHALCLDAVERVVRAGRYEAFDIPIAFWPWIERSWKNRDPHLYGRFDLAWTGVGAPKLLEYNADTPTALIEASLSQWHWLEELHPAADQFNTIHEKLIACWQAIAPRLRLPSGVHFAALRGHMEDQATALYVADCASQAGLRMQAIAIEDIGWDRQQCAFVDMAAQPIHTLFKLYPTEWLMQEAFGAQLPSSNVQWLEPPWKLLLSSKAILPLLWDLHPRHPNLLPAFYGEAPGKGDWIQKPLYSREGANVSRLYNGQQLAQTPGAYGRGKVIHQAHTPLFQCDGRYAVIGGWVIGNDAAGIGIREDSTAITQNLSQFVPHYFE